MPQLAVDSPVADDDWPTGHSEHVADPNVLAKLPGLHNVHDVDPLADAYCPGAQLVQVPDVALGA